MFLPVNALQNLTVHKGSFFVVGRIIGPEITNWEEKAEMNNKNKTKMWL